MPVNTFVLERRTDEACPHADVIHTPRTAPVFVLVGRGTGERHVIPAKAATESWIRLLLADHQQELLTIYTGGFRVYEPLDEDNAFTREYVAHGDGEYVDGDAYVNSCESHVSLAQRWLPPHRGVSKGRLTPYL